MLWTTLCQQIRIIKFTNSWKDNNYPNWLQEETENLHRLTESKETELIKSSVTPVIYLPTP